MKRILFYESRPEWGGAQKCELELLLALDHDTLETFFVTSTEGPMNQRINAADKQMKIIPINKKVNNIRKDQVKTGILHPLFHLFSMFPHLIKVMLFILRNRIDLVYTSQFRSQLIIGWLAKMLGRKVIWHIHGEEQLGNLLGKVSVASADRIIVVSHRLAEKYRALYPKQQAKFTVVHNGVDVPLPEIQKDTTVFTISMVGTLVEGKRQDLAIVACASLIKMGYNVHLNILGEKPPWHSDEYKNSLKTLVKHYDCEHAVSFLGWIETPWEQLSQSTVFILPSDTEGMPLSIIEAMALGLPTISTTVGGVPELIEDEITGFLIPPGNVGELTDKLKLLLDHPSRCEQMGKQARKRHETYFTKESFVKGVEGVINTMM